MVVVVSWGTNERYQKELERLGHYSNCSGAFLSNLISDLTDE